MAELGLMVNILAKVDKALTEIDKIKTKMKKMAEEASKQTDRATLSAKRMGASLAMVGMLAGKAFKSIVDASPGVQVAFILMGVQMENMWRSIGENLAPVIEDILSPAIQALSEYIQDLEPEIQTWIGLTIGLTFFIGALAMAVAALEFVSLPLIGAILLLGGAIAFVILSSGGYLDGMADDSWELSFAIGAVNHALGGVTELLYGLYIIGKILFLSFIGILEGIWVGFVMVGYGLYGVFSGIIEILIGLYDTLVGIFIGGDAFTDGIERMGYGIINFFIGIANMVKGLIVAGTLALLNIVHAVAISVGWDTTKLDEGIAKVKAEPTIPYYHEGGTVGGPRDVMAWLKPKERVRTETQESALQRDLARGGGRSQQKMIVNINITNPSFNERQDIDRLASIIERRLTQSQYQRVFT